MFDLYVRDNIGFVTIKVFRSMDDNRKFPVKHEIVWLVFSLNAEVSEIKEAVVKRSRG